MNKVFEQQIIDRMLSVAERVHAEEVNKPVPKAKFAGIIRQQLVDRYHFGGSIASLILLNTDLPTPPGEMNEDQLQRSAALISANINRLFNAMVEAGFHNQTDALCKYIGENVS